MSRLRTLVLAGGKIHDFKGCGQAIRAALAERDEFEITYAEEDLALLLPGSLERFDLLVFYYTIGEITDAQKNGLLNWVASGNGFPASGPSAMRWTFRAAARTPAFVSSTRLRPER